MLYVSPSTEVHVRVTEEVSSLYENCETLNSSLGFMLPRKVMDRDARINLRKINLIFMSY